MVKLLFQKNDTNQGTIRVASGLDDFGHLAEVKEWKEPKDANFDDEIGFWDQGSKCNKARFVLIQIIQYITLHSQF